MTPKGQSRDPNTLIEHILELDSLYIRRIKADLLLCYKMINNLVDVDVATFLHPLTAGLPEATVLSSKSLTVIIIIIIIIFLTLGTYEPVRIRHD